jgi:hypothetical protein
MKAVKKSLVRDEVKLTVLSANVSAVTFELNATLKTVEQLREQADANYHQYEMMGRNAARELMGSVYAVWCEAKASGQFDSFIANIKEKLKQLAVTVKKSSKPSSFLIRYVFKNASDKQVHVYGRALDVAFDEKKIQANEFTALVEETKGGFDGLRSQAVASTVAGKKTSIALSKCITQRTIDTVENLEWAKDEQYSVFIAVRNPDDTADIKDALLTQDQKDAILMRFLLNKTKQEKTKNDASPNEAIKNLIAELDAKVAEQESIVAQIGIELEMAKKIGTSTLELTSMLEIEDIKLNAAKETVKIAKAALKA